LKSAPYRLQKDPNISTPSVNLSISVAGNIYPMYCLCLQGVC
jgi:hypothetical protein